MRASADARCVLEPDGAHVAMHAGAEWMPASAGTVSGTVQPSRAAVPVTKAGVRGPVFEAWVIRGPSPRWSLLLDGNPERGLLSAGSPCALTATMAGGVVPYTTPLNVQPIPRRQDGLRVLQREPAGACLCAATNPYLSLARWQEPIDSRAPSAMELSGASQRRKAR